MDTGERLKLIPQGPETISRALLCTSVFNCNVLLGVLLIGSQLSLLSPFLPLPSRYPFLVVWGTLPRSRVSETV
ncbi:hypothetical protein GE21DRAFT_1036027 [Neurospora crassa]|nr:hypothetical protein GE21DRAFT_1036027 [Neurospora crassa]